MADFPPSCAQLGTLEVAAQLGFGTDWHRACNGYTFLAAFQSVIHETCGTGADAAMASAREYCTEANPQLRQARKTQIIVPVVIFTMLAITAVALRFRARKFGKISLELDDWLAGTAMAFTFAVNLLEFLGVFWGEGQHSFMVRQEVQDFAHKSTLITLWLMLFALLSLKGSILALYHRIFGHIVTFKRIVFASAAVILVTHVLGTLLYTFSCHPVAYAWDKTIPGGTCWNLHAVMIGMSSVDLATGLWLLCLPVPVLMRMQASMLRRLILIVLFVVGGFACIAAAIRIPFIITIDIYDFFWSVIPFAIWTSIELNIGYVDKYASAFLPLLISITSPFAQYPPLFFSSRVISVCLPALRPLFDHARNSRTSRSSKINHPSRNPNGDSNSRSHPSNKAIRLNNAAAWASSKNTSAPSKSEEDMRLVVADHGAAKEVDVTTDEVGKSGMV